MTKIRLYWEFYKSTVIMNLASSLFFAIIIWPSNTDLSTISKDLSSSFVDIYVYCCMFGGPFVSFFYKETSRKQEYYFYYNKGITKISLLIATLVIYILIGILTLNIIHYAKLI